MKISAPELEGKTNLTLVHIPDAADPETVELIDEGDLSFALGTNEIAFQANSFSIYVITDGDNPETTQQPRVTYHFLSDLNGTPYVFVNKAGDSVDYQIMKNDEKLEDPGKPVTSLEQNFLGWFVVEENTTGEGDKYAFPTGAQPIDFDASHPVKTTVVEGDKDVYVAPRFGQAFIVTFWDNAKDSPEDQMHIVSKRVVYLDEGKDYAEVQVDNVTVPSAATEDHSGWTSDDYKAGVQTTYSLTEMPVWKEVANSFNLYPTFSEGHWLRFSGGPAGSGAGYRSAIFVTANTTAAELTNLGTIERDGYDFAGWYYEGSSEDPFDGTEAATNDSGVASDPADLLSRVQTLTGDASLTLYAHWTGKPSNYRIATWFENADDTEYAFGEVTTASGNTGDTTEVTAEEVEGFTAQTIEQQVIKGNGTTVVNVYYNRNEYEVKFYGETYTATSGNTGTQYGLVDGRYVELVRDGNNWYYYSLHNGSIEEDTEYYYYFTNAGWLRVRYHDGWTYTGWQYYYNNRWQNYSNGFTRVYDRTSYTGTRYVKGDWVEIPELTITAKYGATITNLWPSRRTGLSRTYPVNWRVTPDGSVYQSNQPQMPLNGASFYLVEENTGYIMNTYYYVQDITGGDHFTLDHLDAFNTDNPGWSTTVEDYYDILGFTVNFAQTSDATDGQGNTHKNYKIDTSVHTSTPAGSAYEQVNDTTYQVEMYYLRNKYTVSFDTQISGAPSAPDFTDIYYKANIAQVKASDIETLNGKFVPGETKVDVTGSGTYVFRGWYDNSACLGEQFSFNKEMPAGNIILYAKWEKVTYLVQIDPRGGEILPNVNEVTYTWLPYGDTLKRYNIRRDYVEASSGASGDRYYYVNVLADDDPNARADSGAYSSAYRKGFYIKTTDINNADYSWWKENGFIDTTTEYVKATTNDNYSFVGWYKANVDPESHVITDTNDVYDFNSEITGETAIYAKWRRSGLFSVQYHTENGTVSGQINGELVATDSSYADQATTQIAYTPERITSTDGKSYVFAGWKLAEPDGFDPHDPGAATLTETVYEQGNDFLVDANYADAGHYIHLVAIYNPAETDPNTVPVTTVTFNPNFPDGTTGEEIKYEGVPLNTAIDLSKDSFTYTVIENGTESEKTCEIPTFTCTGYTLIGWNHNQAAATAGTVEFKLTDVVGVDNADPKDNTLYAVWQRQHFYVFHSFTGELEAIEFPTDGSKVNLTAMLSDGTLYGGYFKAYLGNTEFATEDNKADAVAAEGGKAKITDKTYDASATYLRINNKITLFWSKAQAYTEEKGSELAPIAETVYYLREVPNYFLGFRLQYVYDWYYGNRIDNLFLMTSLDNNVYQEAGFNVVVTDPTDKQAKFYASYKIAIDDPKSEEDAYSVTINAESINKHKGGLVGVWDGVTDLVKNLAENSQFSVKPYWITLDGIRVDDTRDARTFNIGDKTIGDTGLYEVTKP